MRSIVSDVLILQGCEFSDAAVICSDCLHSGEFKGGGWLELSSSCSLCRLRYHHKQEEEHEKCGWENLEHQILLRSVHVSNGSSSLLLVGCDLSHKLLWKMS